MTRTNLSVVLLISTLLLFLGAYTNLSVQLDPGFRFTSHTHDTVTQWHITESRYAELKVGTKIARLRVGNDIYDIKPQWLKQTLIDVKTDVEFNQFKASEAFLYAAVTKPVALVDVENNVYPITFKKRHWQHASMYFWSYYLLGFANLFIALITLKASRYNVWQGCNLVAAAAFAMSCVVAVSSKDRLWAMHPDFIEYSFYLGNLGLRIFSVCYFAIFWNIPHRLGKGTVFEYLPAYFALVYMGTWFLQVSGLYQNFGLLMIQIMFVIGAFAIGSLFLQLYFSKKIKKNQLVNLISMRWLFVTNITCALFGFGYNFLWERGYVHSEHADLFNLMSALMLEIGIVVLLLKEHLYRFESWWHAWGFVAGLASCLFSAVWFGEVVFGYTYITFILAVVVFLMTYVSIGFLFRYKYSQVDVQLLEKASEKIIYIMNAADSNQAKQIFQTLIIEAFNPLRTYDVQDNTVLEKDNKTSHELSNALSTHKNVGVAQAGELLLVRSIFDNSIMTMEGAQQGKRLFSSLDEKRVEIFWKIVYEGLKSKDFYVQGELMERRRIAADLQDGIGGKLQELSAVQGDFGKYAHATFEDLKTLTRELSSKLKTIDELVYDINAQLAERCDKRGVNYTSEVAIHDDVKNKNLSVHAATLFSSLLSELLRNALQHNGVNEVCFYLTITSQDVSVRFTNDGEKTDPEKWQSGLGLISMKRRIQDVSGSIAWEALPKGGVLCVASWQLDDWLAGSTVLFQN